MLISQAMAAGSEAAAEAPSMSEAFLYNAGFIFVIVILFWWAFIRPQQKRMQEHTEMLNQLSKGDKVVTGGGLVGTVVKVLDDKEVEIDLGNNLKVVALRSTIMDKPDESAEKPAKKDATKKDEAPAKDSDKGEEAKK